MKTPSDSKAKDIGNRKIFVVGGSLDYASWMQGIIVDSMPDANLVVLTGGEDIDPHLYGRKAHASTSFNRKRDDFEIRQIKQAMALELPMIGICRGSQLLCVAAGGLLVQHQWHPARHKIKVTGGKEITVTSSHHQRQWPWGLPKDEFEVIGHCDLSPYAHGSHDGDNLCLKDGKVLPEVEICLYNKIDALAIQSHPEYCYPPKEQWEVEYIKYCQSLLDYFLI